VHRTVRPLISEQDDFHELGLRTVNGNYSFSSDFYAVYGATRRTEVPLMATAKCQGTLPSVSSHKIDDLLDESHNRFTPLQRLLKTSSDQKQWTAQLRAHLEPPLRHEVEVTNIRGDKAYLLCHSAAVATRMRFEIPALLPRLQQLESFSRVTDVVLGVTSQA